MKQFQLFQITLPFMTILSCKHVVYRITRFLFVTFLIDLVVVSENKAQRISSCSLQPEQLLTICVWGAGH